MSISIRSFLAALTLAALAIPGAATAQRKVVTLTGSLRFLSDAPFEKIQGTAEGATATVTTDLADLSHTSGTIRVPVDSIQTGSPIRDEHVKGEEWLDGKNHPELRFVITEVTDVKSEQRGAVLVTSGTVRGNFTLRGVTRPLSAPVTVKWKGNRVKAMLHFLIRLGDFEIRGRQGIIGKKVGESIEIDGHLTGTSQDG